MKEHYLFVPNLLIQLQDIQKIHSLRTQRTLKWNIKPNYSFETSILVRKNRTTGLYFSNKNRLITGRQSNRHFRPTNPPTSIINTKARLSICLLPFRL